MALFATKLGWFPQNSGYATTTLDPGFTWPFISSVLQHAVLPAVTIVLASIAGWVLGMRNMMITTMDEDYVLLPARAFARYDEAAGSWIRPPGECTVRIGRSSADLPLRLRVAS